MSKGMKRGMFPFKSVGYGLLLVAFGWMLKELYWYGWLFSALGLVLVVGRPWYWLKRGRYGAKASIAKSERKQERSDGVMSRWDHMSNFSATAMRLRWARSLQPGRTDLDGLTGWIRIFREPVTMYAVDLGHSNYGNKYLPLNSVVSRISAARSGKSQALMYRVIDHEGPVVTTSTRGEIYEDTALLRADHGPVLLFNVGQVGHHKSNFEWSLLDGCTDMGTAQRRARDLVGPIPNGDRGRWAQSSVDLFGPLFFLAAHRGWGLRAVQRWINTDEQTNLKVWGEIKRYLTAITDDTGRTSPDARGAISSLENHYMTNDKTRTSTSNTAAGYLAWMQNGVVARLGDSQNSGFDVERDLLDANATLYLLGGKEPTSAPLMRALVAEVIYQANRVAEESPRGRLSPTLLLALDELPLTCPGPVDKWVLDMGGRGVTMDLIAQQRSALDEIWGETGRDAILGNSLALLFGAGCNSRKVAEDYAVLSGTRTELRNSYDAKGNLTGSSEVEVPVIDPGKLMTLQTGESIFFCRGRIDIIRTKRAETRRDVKRLRRGRGKPSRIGRLSEESQRAQDEFAEALREQEAMQR